MATTTNYSWSTPDDTALVKDGAAAIRSLGTAIDTTVFTNAGAAIAKATVDAKGDLIAGTADNTVARLAVGTNGHILVADSATATGLKWAAPAGGGKVLQVVSATTTTRADISSTTYTDTNLTASITPSSATSKILILVSQNLYIFSTSTNKYAATRLMRDSTAILNNITDGHITGGTITGWGSGNIALTISMSYVDSPNTTSAITYKTQGRVESGNNGESAAYQKPTGESASSIVLLEIGA